MRDLSHVIERILNTVPVPLERDYARLRDSLSDISHTAKRTAQLSEEDVDVLWSRTERLIKHHVGEPDEVWKQRIYDIFGDGEKDKP